MADVHFTAMGGRARLSVPDSDAALLEVLVAHVADLERRWSRFIDTSEVSRLGDGAGRPCVVSEPTAALLARARAAHIRTGGWFDPLVASDRDARAATMHAGSGGGGPRPVVATRPRVAVRPSLTDVDVDEITGVVHLPGGARFDPGGLGKGYAADRTAAMARCAGAAWVVVDLGGDIAVAGALPEGEFTVHVEDPFARDRDIARLGLVSGGVATSGTGRQRWRGEDGSQRHHLIDPRTGRSARTDLRSATVLATEAWWAEAVATSVVVAGRERGREMLGELGLPALLVGEDGVVTSVGGVEAYLR